MDSMGNHRFWMIGIIILVILNLGMMAFIWYDRMPPRRDRYPAEKTPDNQPGGDFMVRELGLNSEQAELVRSLHTRQVRRSDTIQTEIRRLYKDIADELFSPAPDTGRIRQLAEAIGHQQAEFERGSFETFLEIKRICNPDQQVKFKRLITDLLMRSLPSPPADLERHDFPPPQDAGRPGPPANPPPPDKDRRGP
jgi:protein CpxP